MTELTGSRGQGHIISEGIWEYKKMKLVRNSKKRRKVSWCQRHEHESRSQPENLSVHKPELWKINLKSPRYKNEGLAAQGRNILCTSGRIRELVRRNAAKVLDFIKGVMKRLNGLYARTVLRVESRKIQNSGLYAYSAAIHSSVLILLFYHYMSIYICFHILS